MLILLYLILGVVENIQEVVGHITEGVCRPLKLKDFIFMYVVRYLAKILHYSFIVAFIFYF